MSCSRSWAHSRSSSALITQQRALYYVPVQTGHHRAVCDPRSSVDVLYDDCGVDTVFNRHNQLVFPDGARTPFHKSLKVVGIAPVQTALMGTQGRRSTQRDSADAELCHRRLMHCGEGSLRLATTHCEGMDPRIAACKLKPCDDCLIGNAIRQPCVGTVPTPGVFG